MKTCVRSFFCVVSLVLAAYSQPLRCNLINATTVINGVPAKQCLDIDVLKGKTLVIPSNVTRLDNSGFGLCEKNVSIGGNADIVFINDQSGSMNATTGWINTAVNPRDTVYYFGTAGCTGGNGTNGNITVPVLEAGPKSVLNRNSGTGCTDFSGDPLNARNVAVRSAIDYIASASPTSTAGYLGFAGTVLDSRRPLQLNSAANVNSVKNSLILRSASSTDYRYPLDSARKWLNDVSLRKNSKAGIIFISDGSNNGPAYLDLVNATMPPIYGIFLGKNPTSDTANLKQLSTLTGGAYYRVPPNRPDSLISVVKTILDLLLQTYDPEVVTVTNSSLVPPQTSRSVAFNYQGNLSWQLQLDSVIALLPNASNSIRVIATFQDAIAEVRKSDTSQFILSTTGVPALGTTPIPGSNFVAQCYASSQLRWLNAAGLRPAFFTEIDTVVHLRLRGSDSALNVVQPLLSTRRSGDVEGSSLPRISANADSALYDGVVNMRVAPAAVPNSGFLQPLFIDSVIATCVNPRDVRDFARDTIAVAPGNRAARAYFSTNSAGTDTVSSFPPTATEAWIVIVDNRASPGRSYVVNVTDSVSGTDHETFTLTEVTPGIFSARIPLEPGVKVNNNGRLQFSPAGDQMRAIYLDPVYGDSAVASAGIGASVQEAGTLVFTDANGIALPNNSIWPLDRGRVYVRYSDDKSIPRLASKTVQIATRTRRLGQTLGQDAESLVLTDSSSLTQTLESWRGNMGVVESLNPITSNGVIEGAYRIEVTATVAAHDNTGQPTGQNLIANLIIAHPDSAVSLTWTDSVSVVDSLGPSTIFFTIRDQDFVRNANDTLLATVICPSSGDSVAGLRLPQIAPGVYASEPLLRDGLAANRADRILSCPAGSNVLLSYTDAVYGTNAQWILPEVQTPVATPAGETFVSQDSISLSTATALAQINYTRDGSLSRVDKPVIYAAPFLLYATTTLRAIASRPGYLRSRVMTENYMKTPFPSQIFILDVNGNPLPNRTVFAAPGAMSRLRILVNTSQGGLGGVSAEIRSRRLADVENKALDSSTFDGKTHGYFGRVNLLPGAVAAASGNDTLESILPDTLIAVWINPMDSTDIVSDTAFVAPSFKASYVYFSNSPGGLRVTQFPVGTTTVYVVDSTTTFPGRTYQVTVSDSVGGVDTESYAMTEIRPGIFSATVPVQPNGVKTVNNGTLQVSIAGDQLQAMFIHPVYGDTTFGVAGYRQAPEEIPSLRFLDTLGLPLAAGDFFSPDNRRVRVSYTDDWSSAIDNLVHQKTLAFVLKALRGTQILGVDSETVIVTYDSLKKAWEGTYPLRDSLLRSHDGILESQFRGELTAGVVSHKNTGVADGDTATSRLVIAYPDLFADVEVSRNGGGPVDRLTDSLSIQLTDQIFTKVPVPPAQVAVQLKCLNSGDQEDIWLTSDGQGNYTTRPVPKEEFSDTGAPALNNGRLSCLESDVAEVDYSDPVYGTTASAGAIWSTPGFIKLKFVSATDSITEIASVSDTISRFLAVVKAFSPNRTVRDTFWVRLTTAQGEVDSFPAVETTINSGVFIASIPFKFTFIAPVTGDREIEAQLNFTSPTTSVPVTGVVQFRLDMDQAVITLFSQFNPPRHAYAKDRNGDGRADWIGMSFAKKLTRLPPGLDSLYWNSEIEADRRSAGSGSIGISSDSLEFSVDLRTNAFPPTLTGLPNPLNGKSPVVKLPVGKDFGGLSVPLEDSVGPVPLYALRRASSLATRSLGGGETRVEPDTLVVAVSEFLHPAFWRGVFRFRSGVNCLDSSAIQNSLPIITLGDARSSGDSIFTLYLDNQSANPQPQIGDCIFLETDGRFTDTSGNLPGVLGVLLSNGGGGSQHAVRQMIGYPPVTGLNQKSQAYELANNSNPGGLPRAKDSLGKSDVWFPPVDWTQGQVYPPNGGGGAFGLEGTKPGIPLPTGYATVEVLTAERYTAKILIYDHFGSFVKSWSQQFGYHGELANRNRGLGGFIRSYLVWDEKDSRRQWVGSGAYVWKVAFTFDGGRHEVHSVRTGLVR